MLSRAAPVFSVGAGCARCTPRLQGFQVGPVSSATCLSKDGSLYFGKRQSHNLAVDLPIFSVTPQRPRRLRLTTDEYGLGAVGCRAVRLVNVMQLPFDDAHTKTFRAVFFLIKCQNV